ncbi:MAG: hypothetical protein Q8P18_33140, partial [Pseudomonadota bacterium]|nr:hypothetical protein [Pseudomonadota bacterium]
QVVVPGEVVRELADRHVVPAPQRHPVELHPEPRAGEPLASWNRAAIAARADALDATVSGWREELVRAHGARILARPAILHALGEAAILRDATDAAVRAVTSDVDAARAEVWLYEAESRLAALLRPRPAAGLLDRALAPMDVS